MKEKGVFAVPLVVKNVFEPSAGSMKASSTDDEEPLFEVEIVAFTEPSAEARRSTLVMYSVLDGDQRDQEEVEEALLVV